MENIRVGRYLIYGLIDPDNSCLRYIGKTHKRKEMRLEEHISKAIEGNTRDVYDWIRGLLSKGMKPIICILERISPEDNWRLAERRNIKFWKNLESVDFPYTHPPQTPKSREMKIASVSLLNQTDGG